MATRQHRLSTGWSSWHKAMAPDKRQGYKKRPGMIGYKITRLVVPNGHRCGIYEWKIVHPVRQVNNVVYVGSTCRSNCNSLRARIKEYCSNGSHKRDEINEALRRGYELHFRTKPALDEDAARRMEEMRLRTGRTNYSWNVVMNG